MIQNSLFFLRTAQIFIDLKTFSFPAQFRHLPSRNFSKSFCRVNTPKWWGGSPDPPSPPPLIRRGGGRTPLPFLSNPGVHPGGLQAREFCLAGRGPKHLSRLSLSDQEQASHSPPSHRSFPSLLPIAPSHLLPPAGRVLRSQFPDCGLGGQSWRWSVPSPILTARAFLKANSTLFPSRGGAWVVS